MNRPFVIGIAGGTGSGKTTLTNAIAHRYQGKTAVVYHDNYYKAHDDLDYEHRAALNYDSPDAFDNDLMIADLRALVSGSAIESPVYDYAAHNRSADTMHVEPAPVILVEGILIFHDLRMCDLFDVKIFVDTDADVRIMRRIKRDVLERGRSIESVEAQYLTTVKPMHELYVEPSKRRADLIIPEGGQNLVALDMLFHRIAHELGVEPR
ncbi:uridine kinase [Arcanobacterium canis]|uniref:Uridine kinase n=1 Tax=Arcanobacterium canis TaxID=999183 RepID=A0ABY8G1W3_9ACTO|nr:uridine kinase [Arcanobacterium canis]WFM83776.1 uridine kinase [Arcanobacterium canis]